MIIWARGPVKDGRDIARSMGAVGRRRTVVSGVPRRRSRGEYDRAILAGGWIYWRAVVLDGLRELVGILENGLVILAVSKLAQRKLDSVY